MSRRLNRLWLLSGLLLASHSWALGLGDIRLDSALNEPLRAEIDLLSASDEELKNLNIRIASVETFARYDLDRPLFLSSLEFEIVRSGSGDGGIVRVTSSDPVTEPFVTFLVEAVWSRGRLLREYTVLLDPPAFAPPTATQTTQAVTAPTQATQTDRGQIQRPAPQPAPPQQTAPAAPAPVAATTQPRPAAQESVAEPEAAAPETSADSAVAPVPEETPVAMADDAEFDATPGGDLVIQRGDTLWGLAQRVRPDSRLSMQQTMLAIYETNPQAFAGNINMMSAGATLTIPSADEVFRISRNDALAEVLRQNNAWRGITPDTGPQTQQGLTLVPPDDDLELFDDNAGQSATDDATIDFVDPEVARISEIEAQLIDHQNSVIEINDNELAALRSELAELRGEAPPEPVVPDEIVADVADADATLADDTVEPTLADDEATGVADAADEDTPEVVAEPPPPVVAARPAEDGLVSTILGYLSSFWVWIGAAILAAVGMLVWFARRPAQTGDDDPTGLWESLDAEEAEEEAPLASTARLQAIAREDDTAIVVVEQESAIDDDALSMLDTLEVPATDAGTAQPEEDDLVSTAALDDQVAQIAIAGEIAHDATLEVAPMIPEIPDTPAPIIAEPSLDDTFSSETAINLDQSDPVAEADFHMAYGLYDQAADLINGALEVDSDSEDLLAKLCEIYFVWGNRDAFIDAAGRMHAVAGGQGNAEWDKIVIMGQQIASDHELFSGVSAGAATRQVDLEFDGSTGDTGILDLDLAAGDLSEVFDVGEQTDQTPAIGATEVEFDVGEDLPGDDLAETLEVPQSTLELPEIADTAAVPSLESQDTVESPTIEQQFENTDETQEMPGVPDLGPNDATALASLDDFDDLEGIKPSDATAEIDLDDLGLDLDGLDDMQIAGEDDEPVEIDESLAATGRNPTLTEDVAAIDADVDFDPGLLEETGQTQVLEEVVPDGASDDAEITLSDDEKTMLASSLNDDDGAMPAIDLDTLVAPLDDESTTLADDNEFSLTDDGTAPENAAGGGLAADETGEMPGIPGATDMDLDLDDLTAALQVSEVGDTIAGRHLAENLATVEQPLLVPGDDDAENAVDISATGLIDARTMTEVGTKLDLARAYVDMGDPGGARSILEEVLDEGDEGQRQQAQQLLEGLPT